MKKCGMVSSKLAKKVAHFKMNSTSKIRRASGAAAATAEFNNIVFPSRLKEAFRVTYGPLNNRDGWNF